MNSEILFARYSRQIFIDEVGVAGQREIIKAKVLVIGAGGLGSPVIQYLAAAGVGNLAAADFDTVALHNLNRQLIHSEESVGTAKVHSAAQFVRRLNSQIKFQAICEKIDCSNAEKLLSSYDLIIDGSDNFATRYLINDTCQKLGKPLVYGSVLGFRGQVAVFGYKKSRYLRDIFPEPPAAEDSPDCDGLGVLGPLPGIVGSMMADLALKIIIGLPVPINQLTLIDTLHWNFQTLEF